MRRIKAKYNPYDPPDPIGGASFVIGAEASDAINVGIQLKDANGVALAVRGHVHFYISGDANGDTIIGTGPTTLAIGTDGLLLTEIAAKAGRLTSEANGHIDINFGTVAGVTYYLVLVLPNGKLVVSPAITFAVTTTTTTTTT
jgi:hypothetical protein